MVRIVFRNLRRDGTTVALEYDLGHWEHVRNSRTWLTASDLESFLIGSDKKILLAKLDGRVVRIACDDYYRLRIRMLAKEIAAHADNGDELVELGCGYGYNLFSLALSGRWDAFSGFDISKNGLAAAGEIAAHFGLSGRTRFGRLDLTDPADANFSQIAGKTLFTFFCIEQIPYAVESVIRNILRQRPRKVIHIEPCAELLKIWKPMDLLNLMHIRSMDYQSQLFFVLNEMSRKGEIRILDTHRVGFAPTIHHDGFLIAWEPI